MKIMPVCLWATGCIFGYLVGDIGIKYDDFKSSIIILITGIVWMLLAYFYGRLYKPKEEQPQ